MRRVVRLVGLLVGVLLLAGCLGTSEPVAEIDQVAAEQREALQETEAPGGSGGEGSGALTFVAIDIAWEDAPSEVAAGVVEMEIVNEGAIVHNIVIEELGDELVVEANGGETATGEVELEPGEITYYCDIAGHREAGMVGTLTVR